MAAPEIVGCQPSFRIDSYDEAISHYVDWLGFSLDWEWRSEPNAPAIVSVSRDHLSLFLNEAETTSGVWLRVSVVGLEEMFAEWNSKRPGIASLVLEPPYDLPTVYLEDPFGNGMALQEAETDEMKRDREDKISEVVAHLQTSVLDGAETPKPGELAKQCACSAGIASDALARFAAARL